MSTDLEIILALLFGGWLGWVAYSLCAIYEREIAAFFKRIRGK